MQEQLLVFLKIGGWIIVSESIVVFISFEFSIPCNPGALFALAILLACSNI
jgi:hypothetical protein